MIRGIILGAALSLAFLQPAHALLVCARSDPDTGLPKERSKLFLRTACITGREVPVGIELIGTPGTDGEVALSGVNLDLPDSSSSSIGNILKNGTVFLHDFGTSNTFLGSGAGNFTMTGAFNTGVGKQALSSNTTGLSNTWLPLR